MRMAMTIAPLALASSSWGRTCRKIHAWTAALCLTQLEPLDWGRGGTSGVWGWSPPVGPASSNPNDKPCNKCWDPPKRIKYGMLASRVYFLTAELAQVKYLCLTLRWSIFAWPSTLVQEGLKHQIHPWWIHSQGRTLSQWQRPPISLLYTVTNGPPMLLGLVPIPQTIVLQRGQSTAPSVTGCHGVSLRCREKMAVLRVLIETRTHSLLRQKVQHKKLRSAAGTKTIKAASSDVRVLVPPSHVGGACRMPPLGREHMPAVRASYRLWCDTDFIVQVGGALTPSENRLVDILRPWLVTIMTRLGWIQASPADPRGGAVTMWTYPCIMCIYVKSRPRHVNYMWIRCVWDWFALATRWRSYD